MDKFLFKTKNIIVSYNDTNREVEVTLPNKPLPKTQSGAVWVYTWSACDEFCVTSGDLLSRRSILKIMRILKDYFGINAKIKVYTESELETIRFRNIVNEVRNLVTISQIKYAIQSILDKLPNENVSRHFQNVIENVAVQAHCNYDDVAAQLHRWNAYVDNYIAYVRQYR